MSNLINKAKDMLSSNKNDNNYAGTHAPTTHGQTTAPTESYGSSYQAPGGIENTPAYSSSTNAGPHNSSMMNKMDPRVDSDRDHRNDPSSTYGSTTHGGAYTGQTTSGSTNAGTHSSNVMNKMDPRFDSDRDHRNDPTSTYGSSTSGGQYTSQTMSGSTNAGPHSSNMTNKMDPRVDSDYDNRNDPTSRVGGYGQQDNYGVSGANPSAGSHASHGGAMGGAYSHGPAGTTSTGTYGSQGIGAPGSHGQSTTGTGTGYTDQYSSSATPGSGNANQTAGPHNSNLMNKLDPRVDSNMDGSKTYGGNKTHY